MLGRRHRRSAPSGSSSTIARALPERGGPRANGRLLAGLALAALATLGTTGGCAGSTFTGDYNPTVNLRAYRTYTWMRAEPSSAVAEFSRSLVGQRVRLEVERDLAAKGLRPVGREKADLVVATRLTTREKVDNYDWGYPDGTWSVYEGPEVYTDRTKTVLLELLDPSRKTVVWWGAASGRFDEAASKGEVEAAVRRLLAQYPAAPGG